eukprot:scaffold10809_cov34-Phaeocystis_antarctica.AAC.1
MSKALADCGSNKSASVTVARRLGEFLGDKMVEDKGVTCGSIISNPNPNPSPTPNPTLTHPSP